VVSLQEDTEDDVKTLRRFLAASIVALVFVGVLGSTAFAAPTKAVGISTPAPSATTSCDPKVQRCSSSPTPNFVINPGDTGQYVHGKTSMSFCNGQTYVAWTEANSQISVAWGWNGSNFTGKVKYLDMSYEDLTNGIYTAPALTCWKAAFGQFHDHPRLWISFTGTDQKLYYGYFNGPGDDGGRINYHLTVPGEKTKVSTALTIGPGGGMRIGWVGLTNEFLYFEGTNDGGTWINKNTITSETASAGFGMVVVCNPNCFLWIAWPATDPGTHIEVGNFGFNSGAWTHTAYTEDFTTRSYELTLVYQNGTLRIPYAGGTGNLNIDNSTDGGYTFSDDQSFWEAVWGVGAAVDAQNHMWVTWSSFSDTQIKIGTYN
jgi:hypothetical protein